MQEAILSFNEHLAKFVGAMPQPQSAITLRSYYESDIRPEIGHQSPSSFCEDRTALGHWERHTGDPIIQAIGKEHLTMLRDGMQKAGVTVHTSDGSGSRLGAGSCCS